MKTTSTDSSRRLLFESLEPREVMAAGITASLDKAGALNVYGTGANDAISFRQNSGAISILNVAGSWNAASVKSIVVNLTSGGSDIVSLNSQANGGNQALAEAFTVKSGAGTDRVRLADGRESVFTGLGHTFSLTTSGVATLDGKSLVPPTPPASTPPAPPTNWFTANVKDAALRTLGVTLFADGVLSRADMISLFRDAEDSNTVDATELADLRSIVSNTTLFGAMDYVWKLSSYIVSANPANATYLGGALGNLVAGSTSAQLEKLIGKWFLGADHPVAAGGYRQFSGQLFVSGASYADIKQGNLGDCYFLASLGEVALRSPATINNMFIVNGDGTYTVKFFNAGVAQYVTVDSYLPTNAAGALIYAARGLMYNNAAGELWTALAEKAYVQLNELGWERAGLAGSGQNAYAAINGGYIYAALGHITGQATTPFTTTTSGSSFSVFVAAFNAGKSIGFASNPGANSNGVVGSHAYAVVGYDAVTQKVTLFNPWGTEYGLLTLTWAQIQQSFGYFDRTA